MWKPLLHYFKWVRRPRDLVWVALALAVLTICAIHALTLTISPTFWHDEVQINETGRLLLFAPHSDWSVNWWVAEHRPVILWTYLGAGLQELSYQLTAPWPIGPRLASTAGAGLATIAMVGWLRARGVRPTVAALLGLVLFLDPGFVESYRGARTDSWVLALCLCACWLLASGADRGPVKIRSWARAGLAGVLVALSIYVYPTAPLLYPLVLVQLVELLLTLQRTDCPTLILVRAALTFVVAAVVTMLLLTIPLLLTRSEILSEIRPVLAANSPPPSRTLHLHDFINAWKSSPLLPLAGLTTLLIKRNRMIGLALLLVIVYLLTTRVYILHTLYLLPYLVVMLGNVSIATDRSLRYRTMMTVCLAALLVWAGGISLVARPALALSQSAGRDPDLLFASARSSIGPGPHRVYVGAIEYYYPGRQLGWHMYYPWFGGTEAQLIQLWRSMDDVILSTSDTDPHVQEELGASRLCSTKELVAHSAIKPPGILSHFAGAQPYGPYMLFTHHCHR